MNPNFLHWWAAHAPKGCFSLNVVRILWTLHDNSIPLSVNNLAARLQLRASTAKNLLTPLISAQIVLATGRCPTRYTLAPHIADLLTLKGSVS